MAAQVHRWVGSKLLLAIFLTSSLLVACGGSSNRDAVVESHAQIEDLTTAPVTPSPKAAPRPATTAAPTTTPPPATTPAPTTTPPPATTPAPTTTPLPATTAAPTTTPPAPITTPLPSVLTGAAALVRDDFELLRDLRVGLITHRASIVNGQRLADLMHTSPAVELVALFAPEHGIDGTDAAGASVSDGIDPSTGTPIFSLYGLDRSPSDKTLEDVDVLVYDLQDVGSRFFTYISTLGLSMQAANEAGIPFVVLDRPNPLGSQVQGPTLAAGSNSFIGLYPIPSAYGLTSGELAMLIKQQGWLDGLDDLDLRIVEAENWQRHQVWNETQLDWIAPSPNLPSADAALIYPGTVLFEATSMSEGRGTDEPFLTIAAPWIDGPALARNMNERQLPGVAFEPIAVTPRSIPGAAPNPRYLGQEITGVLIIVTDPAAVAGLDVGLHLLDATLRQGAARGLSPEQIIDRPQVFDLLAGSAQVRSDLTSGRPVEDILASFAGDNQAFELLAAGVQLYD